MSMLVLPQSQCTIEFLDNSPISEPALDSRAAPSVGGITAQSVLPQGEIPEEGRTVRKKINMIQNMLNAVVYFTFLHH